MASSTVKTKVRVVHSAHCTACPDFFPDRLSSPLHLHMCMLTRSFLFAFCDSHHEMCSGPATCLSSVPRRPSCSERTPLFHSLTLSRRADPVPSRINTRFPIRRCFIWNVPSASIAVWERKLPVVIPLLVLCLAHWALLYRGMFLITAQYNSSGQACVVTAAKRIFLSTTYFGSTSRVLSRAACADFQLMWV